MNEVQKKLEEFAALIALGSKYKGRIAETSTELGKIANDIAAENLGDTTTGIATAAGKVFTNFAALIG